MIYMEKPHIYSSVILTVLALSAAYLLITVQTFAGDCHERNEICIGSLSGNCYGLTFESVNIEEEQSCQASTQIINDCEELGEWYCSEEGSENWMESVETEGLTCKKWSQKYDIEEVCR